MIITYNFDEVLFNRIIQDTFYATIITAKEIQEKIINKQIKKNNKNKKF